MFRKAAGVAVQDLSSGTISSSDRLWQIDLPGAGYAAENQGTIVVPNDGTSGVFTRTPAFSMTVKGKS